MADGVTREYSLCDDQITIVVHESGCGNLSSTLKEPCPRCAEPFCFGECINDPTLAGVPSEDPEEMRQRIEVNRFIDGMESLILSCACVGIDIESEAFQHAVRTSIDAATNLF